MIHNFLKQLLCIHCSKSLISREISIKGKRIHHGYLRCKKCKKNYEIKKGVILFSNTRYDLIKDTYDNYWSQLPSKFQRKEDFGENFLFKRLKYLFKNQIVFDAGCGDGRSIKTICKYKPKLLVVADFTDIIFYTSKIYNHKFQDIPIVFIKMDLGNQFIKKNFFNTTISLGAINFKINQKKIIKNLDKITKNLLLIGLVSNISNFGKFYQKLNPLRHLFKLRLINFFINILKVLILNKYLRKFTLFSIIGNCFYSSLEFVVSPIIYRNDNSFYQKNIKKKNLFIYTSKLLDYLVFRSNDEQKK